MRKINLPVDPFIIALVLAAGLGYFVPASGFAADIVDDVKDAAIALLFFLQGVRLERAAIVAGLTHWRLQLLTLLSTFVLFPVLGLVLHAALPGAMSNTL